MRRTPLSRGSAPKRYARLRSHPASRRCNDARCPCNRHPERMERAAARERMRKQQQFGAYAWLIRALPCAACNPAPYGAPGLVARLVRETLPQIGRVRRSEAAHVVHSVGADGGKPEHLAPLCAGCHRTDRKSWHNAGCRVFASEYHIDMPQVARWIAATREGRAILSIDRRVLKALSLRVEEMAPGAYHVTGGDNPQGQYPNRNAGYPACSCEDHLGRGERCCKHICAVRLHADGEPVESVLRDLLVAEVLEPAQERARGARTASGGEGPSRSSGATPSRAEVDREMDAIFGAAEPMGVPADVLARDEERRRATRRADEDHRARPRREQMREVIA